MKTAQLKLAAAGIGAGALVAMGALGVVLGGAPDTVPANTVAFNQTEEEPAPNTTPATTFAEPSVEVEVPDGYDQIPD